MKKRSTSLIFREMQIKTTIHIISHHSEWLSLKSQKTMDAGGTVEKREHLYTDEGNINWCFHFGKQTGDFPKNLKQRYHFMQQSHHWVYTEK